MSRPGRALFVCLVAAPALATDYSLTCDLGPPAVANFSLFRDFGRRPAHLLALRVQRDRRHRRAENVYLYVQHPTR